MTTTLLNEKFLSYKEETRKYQLGYCALALGISKLASIDLIEVSRPILEELANRSNMFIHLAILEDEKVVVISKIFPKARMQSTTRASSAPVCRFMITQTVWLRASVSVRCGRRLSAQVRRMYCRWCRRLRQRFLGCLVPVADGFDFSANNETGFHYLHIL